jgi:hypothetical protein
MRRASIIATLLLVVSACTGGDDGDSASGAATIPQATRAELEAAGLDELPLAPRDARVDLRVPRFSNPTRITNPLFPISRLHSVVLNGTVEGKAFRTETTLLPHTRVVEWPRGQRVRTLVSQYVAYLDGRIEEVALDLYAQADDGSVWYFGEDVFNYEDGVIADREGTWHAGVDGPAAMIMPADPQPGDVYLPENVPGLVFEQVTVKPVDRVVEGPRGSVKRAIVAEEVHQDGAREDKIFAAGYGEFFTGSGGDVEALALAVPTDRLRRPMPAALRTLASSADPAQVSTAWNALRSSVPPRLAPPTTRAVEALTRAVAAGNRARARQAAIDVHQAALDLQLQYREPAEIDLARLDLWARQLLVDTDAGDIDALRGDVSTLEWIRDRVAPTLKTRDAIRINVHLGELLGLVADEDLDGLATEAERLRATLMNVDG